MNDTSYETVTPGPRPAVEIMLSMLRQMIQIRVFEEALFHAFKTEKMPGTMHQAIGMEAVSAGIGHALRPDDLMTSTHRGHGHAIAKGLSLDGLMAEMYARETGVSRGMGGSMHIFEVDQGFLGTTGIVGAGVPIAVGAGLAAHLEGRGRVAVAFFGDGGSNQGVVHEAINLAVIWKLPVLFVCENNQYAVSMPIDRAIGVAHIVQRAAGYGLPGLLADGNDVLTVYAGAQQAVERARRGGGPTLIECVTYRYKGHSRFEPAAYRPSGELEEWLRRDPINRLRAVLQEEAGVPATQLDAIQYEVEAQVEAAVAFARQSAEATAAQALTYTFV